MPEAILALAVIGIMAILAIRERIRQHKPVQSAARKDSQALNPRIDNLGRYNQEAGYRYSKEMTEDLIDASALANQRISGRHLGPDTHIYVNLGCESIATDFEVVNHWAWLDRYGATNGVYLHAMDGNREMSAAEKNKILYGK